MGKVSKESMLRALKRKGAEGTSEEPREKRSKKVQDKPPQVEKLTVPPDEVVEVEIPTPARPDVILEAADQIPKTPEVSRVGGPALGDPERSTRLLYSALMEEDLQSKKDQPGLIGFTSSMACLYELASGLVVLQQQKAALERHEQALIAQVAGMAARQKELEAQLALKDSKMREAENISADLREEVLSLRNEVGPLRGVVDELRKLAEAQEEEIEKTAKKAVSQFRGSEEYEDELSLECIGSYKKGFKECKTMVREKFPDVDASLLVCEMGEDEEEEKEAPSVATETAPEAAQPIEIIDITQASNDEPQA